MSPPLVAALVVLVVVAPIAVAPCRDDQAGDR